MNSSGTVDNSGIQRRIYVPWGSYFLPCNTGLNTLKYGAASVPVPAAHCQPPLFADGSPSTRYRMKYFSPLRQSISRSLVRKEAVIILARLCIQPVEFSC